MVPGGAAGGVTVAEILASGTLTEDISSPPGSVDHVGETAVSGHCFTPPMGSLLVAMVAAAGGTGVTVTDDDVVSLWMELTRWASGTSGYAGVWPPLSSAVKTLSLERECGVVFLTVTATEGGSTYAGMSLLVKVLDVRLNQAARQRRVIYVGRLRRVYNPSIHELAACLRAFRD